MLRAHFITFLSIGVLLTPHLWSQSAATGTVSGQISDASGSLLAGAQVKLTDVSTDAARTTLSNDAGRYDFLNVPPGKYNLTAAKQGFSLAKVSNQIVEVGLSLTLNLT